MAVEAAGFGRELRFLSQAVGLGDSAPAIRGEGRCGEISPSRIGRSLGQQLRLLTRFYFLMDQNEQIIANFLRPPSEGGAYTDEKLASLLAHAEDGKLAFQSCCCLIGIPTADHALRGEVPPFEPGEEPHYQFAKSLPNAESVEMAFLFLCLSEDDSCFRAFSVERMQARLIPLIRSEMQRRESSRSQTEVSEVVMV